MELLKFKCGYSFQWLLKVYKFFALDNTAPLLMVPIASYCMEGEVSKWFQGVKALGFYTNWVDFNEPTISILNTNLSCINGDYHLRIQMQEPANYMMGNQELILDAPTQESTFKN